MAAWGFTMTGTRVLLHLMAGSKEDAETVTAFFQDMRARSPSGSDRWRSDGSLSATRSSWSRTARPV